jgi:hypothetical protein
MYIKLVDGQPRAYSIGQLRLDNPQVSFPQDIPVDTLAEYNVFLVTPTDRPTPSETGVVEDAGFLQLADGTWKQAWRVRPLNEQELEELAQQTDEQRRYAYQMEADPLFFKAQRGEATMEEWLDKVAEIKSRFKETYDHV